MLNANNDVTNADSDAGLEASSEAGLRASSEANFDLNNTKKADLVSGVLAIKADKSRISEKKSIKATSLMQPSELIFLMKCLSISALPNIEDFILWFSIMI